MKLNHRALTPAPFPWERRHVNPRHAPSLPPTRSAVRAWGLLLPAAMLAVLVPSASRAQARLEAQYEASLAGIVVGKGGWAVDILEDQYSANAYGGTSGLMKTFSSGSGNTSSQGRVVNGALVATNYSASTVTAKRSEQIHMTLQNGTVKDYGIDPTPPVDPDRIPVTEAHRRGVYDPMTAALLRVPGNGDPLTPEACRTAAAIFDGRMRYDLKLDFKRAENVKADKGYHGPAIVCAVYFTPIAGYIPDRPVIKYLAAQRDIEITFVPLPGTRILVPFRMRVPTPLGMATLEATQFVTQVLPPHLAKTQ
jgi:Protein of unknown function (DUF3108)